MYSFILLWPYKTCQEKESSQASFLLTLKISDASVHFADVAKVYESSGT